MTDTTAPGRTCPLHYHYGPAVFRQPPAPDLAALDVLYVVGGLYGNELALHEVLRLFEAEKGHKRLVFNGDFHWFDIDPATFDRVQRAVLAHTALRGNVETELADADPAADPAEGAGCGCAYPDWVGDAVVERSNRIHQRLLRAVTAEQRQQLAALPMWLTASVGGLSVGIVHGDAQSLAGWGFAQEHLSMPEHREQVREWFKAAGVDAFACSHTCLPVFQRIQHHHPHPQGSGRNGGHGWVFNNGAAGMPNFSGDTDGLLTRFATTAFAGPQSRTSTVLGGALGEVFADAIAIEVDAAQVQQAFLAQWPAGSDAHASYFGRIQAGPDYHPHQVIRLED